MPIFNSTFNNATLWNGITPVVPPLPSMANILLAMIAQIVSKGLFTADMVGISLTKEPSLNVLSNHYATLTPGREDSIGPQVYAIGRYASGMLATVYVNVYDRLALDVAYEDEYFLTNNLGLRPLVFNIIDALQLFLPVDDNGTPYTEHPIRMIGNESTLKWEKSNEWGFVSIPFAIQYPRACSPTIFI